MLSEDEESPTRLEKRSLAIWARGDRGPIPGKFKERRRHGGWQEAPWSSPGGRRGSSLTTGVCSSEEFGSPSEPDISGERVDGRERLSKRVGSESKMQWKTGGALQPGGQTTKS